MKRCALLVAVLVVASSAFAQNPSTGFPPYGSFEDGRFDAVNRQNLNVNFAIPIVSSAGRGIDLRFAVVYDSLVWTISGGAWTPRTNASGTATWGWKKDSPIGAISYTNTTSTIMLKCFPPGEPWYWATKTIETWSNYVYQDPVGTPHSFGVSVSETTNNCTGSTTTSATKTGYASDGSGYYIDINVVTAPVVLSPSGIRVTDSTLTDTNGNFHSKVVVGASQTDWKDTTGRVALRIITGPSSIQYQFLDPNAVWQTTTLNLQSYNVKTNFGCSGVVEYTGTATLPTSLALPNGQSYSFTYEPTPGWPGYVTGRVQRVTLPTGGYYEYAY